MNKVVFNCSLLPNDLCSKSAYRALLLDQSGSQLVSFYQVTLARILSSLRLIDQRRFGSAPHELQWSTFLITLKIQYKTCSIYRCQPMFETMVQIGCQDKIKLSSLTCTLEFCFPIIENLVSLYTLLQVVLVKCNSIRMILCVCV